MLRQRPSKKDEAKRLDVLAISFWEHQYQLCLAEKLLHLDVIGHPDKAACDLREAPFMWPVHDILTNRS